jgi:hypothetical protein
LQLSHKTIRSNVSTILATLQVADRAPAIVRARHAGLGHQPGAESPATGHLSDSKPDTRSQANLTKTNIDQLAALVKTRLRRTKYWPGLLDGFLAKAGPDLSNPAIEIVRRSSRREWPESLVSLPGSGGPVLVSRHVGELGCAAFSSGADLCWARPPSVLGFHQC